jgi:hypothetical protein
MPPSSYSSQPSINCCRRGTSRTVRAELKKLGNFDRFHQVKIEPCYPGAIPIGRLAVARNGDHEHVVAAFRSADAASNFVAVHFRQTDIEEHHLGLESLGREKSVGSIASNLGRMSVDFENHRQRFGRVVIIIDH